VGRTWHPGSRVSKCRAKQRTTDSLRVHQVGAPPARLCCPPHGRVDGEGVRTDVLANRGARSRQHRWRYEILLASYGRNGSCRQAPPRNRSTLATVLRSCSSSAGSGCRPHHQATGPGPIAAEFRRHLRLPAPAHCGDLSGAGTTRYSYTEMSRAANFAPVADSI
jgi:hypothetical protein